LGIHLGVEGHAGGLKLSCADSVTRLALVQMILVRKAVVELTHSWLKVLVERAGVGGHLGSRHRLLGLLEGLGQHVGEGRVVIVLEVLGGEGVALGSLEGGLRT